MSFKANSSEDLRKLERGDVEPILNINPKPKGLVPTLNNIPFKPGENIVFDIYHKTALTKVLGGHCSMKIRNMIFVNDHWALEFELKAWSADWYAFAYQLNDSIDGFFDINSNKTLFLKLEKRENTYFESKVIEFDYYKNQIIEKEQHKKSFSYNQYPLTADLMDAYSIIYLIRKSDLSKKVEIKYNIYSSGRVHPAHAAVVSEETVKYKGKSYDTYKVKIFTKVEGALEQKGGIFVYFTRDSFKTPVKIEADVKIGTLIGELKT